MILAAGLGCGKSTPPARPDSVGVAPAPTATAPVLDVDTSEAALLAGTNGRVGRVGLTLTLATAGGATVALVDDSSDSGESYRIHRYQGRLAGTPFHLVHVSYFESGGYLLVHDSTGRRIALDGPPAVSPNGRRLAIASFDLEAQMMPNVLTLLELAGDSLRTLWTNEPTDWGPDAVRWINDDSVALIKLTTTSRGPGEYDRVPAALVRRGDAWELVAGPPPK